MTSPAKRRQTRDDREHILQNLPEGTRRVQVLTPQGQTLYKRPEEVNVEEDEILLNKDGLPIIMRGRPGRKPKNKTLAPVTPQIQEVSDARDDHLDSDHVSHTLKNTPESDEQVLNGILVSLAQEAASIEFDRMEAQRHGKETSAISTKRARVLKAMADVVLKRKQLSEGGIVDLESPIFKALFSYILETFQDAMVAGGVRNEQVEQAFTFLSGKLNDPTWVAEAKQRMKGKTK